jgi:hypothetical protein
MAVCQTNRYRWPRKLGELLQIRVTPAVRRRPKQRQLFIVASNNTRLAEPTDSRYCCGSSSPGAAPVFHRGFKTTQGF